MKKIINEKEIDDAEFYYINDRDFQKFLFPRFKTVILFICSIITWVLVFLLISKAIGI